MAGAFRPSYYVNVNWYYDEKYHYQNVKHGTFPTFREFKKNLRSLLKESIDNEVTVYRSRRGDWGEWVEKYFLDGKKIKVRIIGWA